jgi:cobalt/nickel transport system permease protein
MALMQADYLDHYSRLDSPIHRLPASIKLAAAVALILAMVLLPMRLRLYLLLPAILLIAIALLSRIPMRFLVRRVLTLEPFVLGVAVLALFQPHGGGLFVVLVARCTLCLAAVTLLANTTPFSDLLRILKTLRVPGLMITTLALMYRYLFVLMDEAQRMKRARLCRTFVPGRRQHWKSLGTVISQLFIRASERAERIYCSMCARGWHH